MALWKGFRQQERYLYSEVFAQERKRRKMSQEKLADALEIDQKTISRIESGRFKPKTGTLKKLREYLQVERDVCTTRIVVDDFKLLEMEREIAKLISERCITDAQDLYDVLKPKLAMHYKENEQYVRFMDAMFARRLNAITYEEAIEACMEAIRITRKDIDLEQLDIYIFNRLEVFILNTIARYYRQMGDNKKGLKILEGVKSSFQKSKINLRHYYPSVASIYGSIADIYEEIGKYDDSVKGCDSAILFDLECKRGLNLGHSICEKRYAIDCQSGDNTNSKAWYMQAYQIFLLLKLEKERISLQRVYRKWYEEELGKTSI